VDDSTGAAAAPPAGDQAGRRRVQGRRLRPRTSQDEDLREAILRATTALLGERTFAELSVAEILAAAGVSRGSFYFYFDSKHDVLAELVRRAVAEGMRGAEPWLARPPDKAAALRQGTRAGARQWRASASILRAIVENWQSEPRLRALWLEQMQSFTDATVAQIATDADAMAHLAGQDVTAVASGLTWLGERLYYLAACGIAPFDDENTLVDTLVHIWVSTLYGQQRPDRPGGS